MSWLAGLHPMKFVGIGVMAFGPWALMYRHFFVRASYNELLMGSFVFLLAGSFLWFMSWDNS